MMSNKDKPVLDSAGLPLPGDPVGSLSRSDPAETSGTQRQKDITLCVICFRSCKNILKTFPLPSPSLGASLYAHKAVTIRQSVGIPPGRWTASLFRVVSNLPTFTIMVTGHFYN